VRNAEQSRSTTRKPETTFEEVLNAIRDSLTNLPSSDNEQDGKDEDDDGEETELGKFSEDDEPGWVMCTTSQTVPHCKESFRQTQMRIDKLIQLGWGDVAGNFLKRAMKYG